MSPEAGPAGKVIASAPEITSYNSRASSKADWAQALASVFLGLFVALIFSFLFRGGLPLGMLATGYCYVYLYHRRHPISRLTLGLGARLGAFSGALGFAILSVACAAAALISHSGAEIHAVILKAVQDYSQRNPDPQLQQILQFYSSREGFTLMLALGAVMTFALFLALSSLGGMIGAAVLRRKPPL